MQRITTFLLSSVLAGSLAFAQGPGNPPNPANFVQHRISFLTTLLSLTSTQQQEATTIFTNAATTENTLRGSLKTAHQNLRTAVQNNDAATIGSVSTTIGSLTAQLTSAGAKADAAFYQILTPDQQTKFNQFQSQGGGFGHGRGPGGH